MRILSITVRNYRIHQDLTIELDPARTLIGGPNESGKSTLVEAAHRALFLRAKVTGEAQKGMVSHLHPGHPEVEVRFEADGAVYRICKRFSGQSGTATLTREGGETWSQDEAEGKLHALLGVEDVGGGRGVAERAAGQWAHLWVRQGDGGQDPSAHARTQRDSLLAHLDKEGGAAVMESELDRSVASQFAEAREALFLKNGNPRTHSDFDVANKALATAAAKLDTVREKTRTLQQAVDDVTEASQVIEVRSREMKGAAESRAAAEKKLAQVSELRHREAMDRNLAQQGAASHEALVQADREIARLGAEIRAKSDRLEPGEIETARLETEVAGKKERRDEAAAAARRLDLEVRTARHRLELAKAWCARFEAAARKDRLAAAAELVDKLRGEVDSLKSERARLPDVGGKSLDSLKAQESAWREARAALQAMASGITVEASSLPVRVGGELLESGATRIITEESEVEIGDSARLLVTPGGGARLAEVQKEVERCGNGLEKALADLGVESVEEGSRVFAKRADLGGRLKTKEAELKAREADTIDAQQSEAAVAFEAAAAEVERRAGMVEGDFAPPEDAAAAANLATAQRESLDGLESREIRAKAAVEGCESGCQQAEAELKKHRQSVEEAKAALRDLRTRLGMLEEEHGDAKAREEKLGALAGTRQERENQHAATVAALAGLQPESLEADLARFTRAVEQARADIGTAENRRAVAHNILAVDGTTDPAEALALAEADFESARRRQGSLERKAHAIRLLSELFAEEQRALAHQFTRPLADKVTGYLQQLFGPDARVGVELNEGKFEAPVLTRGGRTYRFDELSGGTREQVAAAFRLAMAEILAEDHDGCLPVVFDDAFTNSDPDRVQTLQRMLDLAARGGLQVILLTCAPSDYAALGARSVALR